MLPLLEFALTELWQRIEIDDNGRRLTLAASSAIGGVTGALARHADSLLDELNVDELQVRRLFLELVRVTENLEHDARRPRTKTELDALDPTLWPLAQRLALKRLVVTTSEPAADIVHEALFRRWDRLRTWIAEERDFLRWRQRLDERRREWEEAKRDSRELLNSRALDEAARWLTQRRDALDSQQLFFIQASQDAEVLHATKQHSDRIWNKLEFNWEYDEVTEGEYVALAEFQSANPAIRHEFLLSAANDEPRSRRLCRQSGVAFRAVFAFDVQEAAVFARNLSSWLPNLVPVTPPQAQSVLLMARETYRFFPDLVPIALQFVTAAVVGTTDPDQLRVFTQAIRTLASQSNALIAGNVIQDVFAAIARTVEPSHLEAYSDIIKTFAGRVSNETAQQTIEKAAACVAETDDPDQMQAYAESIGALAPAAAADITHKAAMVAYERLANCLAARNDAEFNPRLLLIYAKMARAMAGIAKSTASAAAAKIIETAHAIVTDNTSRNGLPTSLIEAIKELAEWADPSIARLVIKQAAIEVADGRFAVDSDLFDQAVGSLARLIDGETAREVIEQAVIDVAASLDEDSYKTQSLMRAIAAVAKLVNAEAAQQIIDQVAATVLQSRDRRAVCAWVDVIAAFVGHPGVTIPAVAVKAIVELAAKGNGSDKSCREVAARAQAIRVMAGFGDIEATRTAAVALVNRSSAIVASPDVTDYPMFDDIVGCAKTIEFLSELTCGDIARTAAMNIARKVAACLNLARETYEFDALADAIIAIRRYVPRSAWLFLAEEMLKCPSIGNSNQLERAVAEHCGLPEAESHSLWDTIIWLETNEPWLPLRAPQRPPEQLIKDVEYLAEHGSPLPEA